MGFSLGARSSQRGWVSEGEGNGGAKMCRMANRRGLGLPLAAIAFIVSLAATTPLDGGEARPSREALVAALERAPGPTKGKADAPLTIVEFSDFQCSFCRRFWRETLPRIEERYIQPGKVRFVYRHLAILGPMSEQAAEAAECAHAQGKFWPYHDRLFERAGPFSFTLGRLKGYARELGLDGEGFDRCLDSGRYREKVRNETMVAQFLGATGTPAFLINGKLLIGAHPFETFERILDAELRGIRPSGSPRR